MTCYSFHEALGKATASLVLMAKSHPGLKDGQNQCCAYQGYHCHARHAQLAGGCLSHVQHHDQMYKALQSA